MKIRQTSRPYSNGSSRFVVCAAPRGLHVLHTWVPGPRPLWTTESRSHVIWSKRVGATHPLYRFSVLSSRHAEIHGVCEYTVVLLPIRRPTFKLNVDLDKRASASLRSPKAACYKGHCIRTSWCNVIASYTMTASSTSWKPFCKMVFRLSIVVERWLSVTVNVRKSRKSYYQSSTTLKSSTIIRFSNLHIIWP